MNFAAHRRASGQSSASRRRIGRWLIGAAALVLVPKCAVCVAAYVAAAAGLGVLGTEFCGSGGRGFIPDAAVPYVWTAAALGVAYLAVRVIRR